MSDTLDKQLLDNRLASSAFVLDLNGSLAVPVSMELSAPWNLPSRLFRFPIEVSRAAGTGERRIGLQHPLLADHPFVRHVETLLGIRLDPNGAPNEHGVSNQETAQWWHAVDLVSAGCWRELIDTRAFTTAHHIAGAVSYGLDYSPSDARKPSGYLSPLKARLLLEAIEAPEPCDCAAILRSFSPPQLCRTDGQRERWPINTGRDLDAADCAWARLFGIVEGWFGYDSSGFLQWAKYGRDRYDAGANDFFVETATGQGGFAF